MTKDFIDDAIDSLNAGNSRYVLLAWCDDDLPSLRACDLSGPQQIEWARGRINKMLDEVAEQFS